MREAPVPRSARAFTVSTSNFVATLAVILLCIVVFLAADFSLARIDRDASAARADALYVEGGDLLAHGAPGDAADRFASALAIERTNVTYELALGQALLADGRLAEAEAALSVLLARAETNGAANLFMARVLERERRPGEAKSFYHRAIYGTWGADSVSARLAARLELIELLALERSRGELLAELLPLDGTLPDSAALKRRVGRLFIIAGAPARGASVFRSLLKRDAEDGDAYAGMGEAALAEGNYRTARADFLRAAELKPGDSVIATRAALADTIAAINPMDASVPAHGRFLRARSLLARTIAVAEACGGQRTVSGLRGDSVSSALLRTVHPRDEEAESERLLPLASAVYDALPGTCTASRRPADEALALIQSRLPR